MAHDVAGCAASKVANTIPSATSDTTLSTRSSSSSVDFSPFVERVTVFETVPHHRMGRFIHFLLRPMHGASVKSLSPYKIKICADDLAGNLDSRTLGVKRSAGKKRRHSTSHAHFTTGQRALKLSSQHIDHFLKGSGVFRAHVKALLTNLVKSQSICDLRPYSNAFQDELKQIIHQTVNEFPLKNQKRDTLKCFMSHHFDDIQSIARELLLGRSTLSDTVIECQKLLAELEDVENSADHLVVNGVENGSHLSSDELEHMWERLEDQITKNAWLVAVCMPGIGTLAAKLVNQRSGCNDFLSDIAELNGRLQRVSNHIWPKLSE